MTNIIETITWGTIGWGDVLPFWQEVTANIALVEMYEANPRNFRGSIYNELGQSMAEFSNSRGMDWSALPYGEKASLFKTWMNTGKLELSRATSELITRAMANDPFGSR